MTKRAFPADLFSVLLLAVLCYLFYWRLLTPNPLNQQSMVEGDFSGQFVAFAHYQAERLGAGEVPLWNPYNLGGHPFLADTQSAVFYPPRLLSIALLNATGGPTPGRVYDALQKEMIAHALLASLLMYAFIRRLTRGQPYSAAGGLVGGIVFAYGGYLTGYPPLQLAVMEAGIWLPLALLGIHEGTRETPTGPRTWRWFSVAGLALALSLTAGHPQTSLMFSYVTLGYLAWRVVSGGRGWATLAVGALIFGLVGGGAAAAQLLPGWEYLQHTTRGELSFDVMGNGFPLYDVLQVIFPGLFSLWSPLYFSIAGLILVVYFAWTKPGRAAFWLILIGVALGLSFGADFILYDVFYNFVPGFNLFRGQERSAYVIAVATAVLAGLGASALLYDTWNADLARRYKLAFGSLIAPTVGLGFAVFVEWIASPDLEANRFKLITFSLIFAVLAAGVFVGLDRARKVTWRVAAVVGLVVLELFSFGRMVNPNMEAGPAGERLTTPSVVWAIREAGEPLARSDGIPENYGTLYGVMEIRGISPLRLATIDKLLKLPNTARLWEVMAVRHVVTTDRELVVPAAIIASAGDINVHRLRTARPFARLVYRAWIEPDDDQARGILAEPAFDSAHTVILSAEPGVALPEPPPEGGAVEVIDFAPERITLRTGSPAPALLNLALVYYPGWAATIDGEPAALLRADTAMTALVVTPGDHAVQLVYDPPLYRIGVGISLLVLLVSGALTGLAFIIRQPSPTPDHEPPSGRDPDRAGAGE